MLSKTWLVLLLVYFLPDFSHGRRHEKFFQKDYHYIEALDSYYKIHTTPLTFADAKEMCVLEVASLFYPEDDDEANAVIAYWKSVQPYTDWPVYLGVTDMNTEGQFETIDGRTGSDVYKHWRAGEPNNHGPGDEDCVILDRLGETNDVQCHDKQRFICKKKDYSYIEAVDSYYRIHTTPRTFADAKQTCDLEGASLFYPEDENEANAVIAFWKRVHPSTDWAAYVGLTDMATEGTFQTIDERSISHVHKNWREGEPNNHGPGEEDCVVMFRQGNMNDVECDKKYRFICKKNDYNYIEAEDSYYKIHTIPRTFADAQQTCVLEGASLFYPEDNDEAKAVIAYWKRVQPSTDWALYVGLTDMATEGTFQTIDEKAINGVYNNWREGEPNNRGSGGEDCVILYRQGNMNDVPCGDKFPFFCKKKDYSYIAAVDSYYKIHSTPRSFADAKQTCDQEGASLFYPEDDDEANAVIAYWKRVQPSTDWAMVVGLTDLKTEGIFQTIDGRTISDVYKHWRKGEPNNNGPDDEDCVILYYTGKMNDVKCVDKFSFICKKKDYSYIKAVNSYYKIHTKSRSFADAKQTCGLEGASLFYPEDDNEAKAVIAYWKRIHPSTDWPVLVGLTDMETEGTFQTISGKTISDVYRQWRNGEPNNHGPGDEDCVVLFRQGNMNDVQCDDKYRFICKKKKYDYEFIQAVDSYYKIHTTPRTFADAMQTCVLEGASLFYPEDKDEAKAVIEYWKRVQPSTDWPMFLGLTDMNTEGTFVTIDGRTISDVYENWRKGEPNNHGPGDEDCVILYGQGDMNDVPCDDKFPFFCKRRQSQNWNKDCNMANLDYTFSENIGNCYKLHTTPLTWIEAYDVCHAEQSHLAVIDDALEADYLTKLTMSAKQRFGRTYQRGTYHLGVHNVPDEGWQTVTGESISDADALWSNFLSGADDNKKCGSMTSTGFLNKIDCNKKSFFICEHEIDGPTESPFSLDNEENYQ